jgi:hypothetical protein
MDERIAKVRWEQSTVLQRTCAEVFGGSRADMLVCARYHVAHGVPNRDLGVTFRRIVGSRPRGEFWKRAASILEALVDEQPSMLTVQLGDAKGMKDAVRRVQKYQQRILVMSDSKAVAALVPVEIATD